VIAWIVGVFSTILLCVRGYDERARWLSLAVYGAGTILVYGVSADYHLGARRGQRRAALRSVDQASIDVLFAGT
jgi:channel protein (hemolysin III family)